MRQLVALFASLCVTGAFLLTTPALSQPPPAGGTTVVRKVEVKETATGKPAVEAKKAEAKKEESKKEAVKVKAAQRLVVRGRAAAALGEANQQLQQQYRPMLWAEYHLARTVCDLTQDQRKAIAREAEHVFQETIAKVGQGVQIGIRVNRVGGNARNEPEDSIREGLSKAVRDHLKPEQSAKYQAELDKRSRNRKRIAVDNITAKVDESLFLTVEQRDKIRESLSKNWKESWCPSPDSLLFNAQMIPQIPDQFIVPILNENQKSIWRGLNKYSMANFRFFGFMGNNMANGDTPEDEILREAREAETKSREEAGKKQADQQANEADSKKAEEEAKNKAKPRDVMKTTKKKSEK